MYGTIWPGSSLDMSIPTLLRFSRNGAKWVAHQLIKKLTKHSSQLRPTKSASFLLYLTLKNGKLRILSGTVENEASGAPTPETGTPEIAMEEKETSGAGDQVLVLEFCQGQWGMKRRGRQRQKLGHQKLRWKKRKRRGRGDQVLVLEFSQGQWGMKRRGRQRQRMGHQKLG